MQRKFDADMQKLRVVIEQHDISGILKVAHSLKGVAGSMQAIEVQELVNRTMIAARNNGSFSIEYAKQLVEAIERLIKVLKQCRPN